MDYGAYNHPNNSRENYFLHPDDAALPPVVRTAKPPSGFSALTAPSKPASLKARMRPISIGSQSTGSKDNDDMVSIGNLSVEPGVPPACSSESIKSAGSGGKGFLKNRKGLLYMGSKERLRENEKEKEYERKRNTLNLEDVVGGLGIEVGTEKRTSLPATTPGRPRQDETREDGEAANGDTSQVLRHSPRNSPDIGGPGPNMDDRNGSPRGIGSGRFIPNRDSSLRHSRTESSSNAKRRSRRASDDVSPVIQDIEPESVQPVKVTDNTEEDNVARRIKELKAQKKEREDQPALQTTDIPLREGGPVGPPVSLPPQPPKAPPQSASTLASTQLARKAQVQEVQDLQDEGSAPSPAIVQRTNRGSGARASFTNNKPGIRQPPFTKTSLDVQRSPRASIRRSNSRFKRFSGATSPDGMEKHRRTLSNPLAPQGRTPQGRTPQVVEERPSSADSIDYAVEEYLASPRLSQKIRHPQTGRVISFSEVGDPTGSAVICCVGMGLTRYVTAFYDELALTLKLRLITPDRPGVGDSEPYADDTGTPLGWPGKASILLESSATALTNKRQMMFTPSVKPLRLQSFRSLLTPRGPYTL